MIFHDATLRAMATERPRSLKQLALINGVGVSKLERYGEQMLAVLNQGEVAIKEGDAVFVPARSPRDRSRAQI